MLHNFVQSNTSVMTINQKYLECGHMQIEVDSVHSVIEQAKKSTEVFIPKRLDQHHSKGRKDKSIFSAITES